MVRQLTDSTINRFIKALASKMFNEGVTFSNYTKARAKRAIKGIVANKAGNTFIDKFSPEIKKELKKKK